MINDIKVSVDNNDPDMLIVDFTYTPVQPVNVINMTTTFTPKSLQNWQGHLRELYIKYVHWKDMNKNTDHLAQLNEVFKEKYPGPFVVEEFYNAKIQDFDARLKFDDPKQETMWKIRNS